MFKEIQNFLFLCANYSNNTNIHLRFDTYNIALFIAKTHKDAGLVIKRVSVKVTGCYFHVRTEDYSPVL